MSTVAGPGPIGVICAAVATTVLAVLLLLTADRGEQMFRTDCAGCHGPRGEGGVGPPLAVPRLSRARDAAALAKLIEHGIEGTEMPAARRAPTEIAALVDWVGQLSRRPAEKVPGDAGRGALLYAGKGGCAACHTIDGRGGALAPTSPTSACAGAPATCGPRSCSRRRPYRAASRPTAPTSASRRTSSRSG